MPVIDFHSHILPGIDDGARNVETSLAMLEMAAEQQVDVMFATPHFYASRDRIDSFLKNREEAWKLLKTQMEGRHSLPEIHLGAEVAFFDGISRAEDMQKLTVQGSNLLLLEMPFQPWTDRELAEVDALMRDRGFRVMIAHLERFMWIPGNKKKVQKLLELPVLVQINAEAFDSWLHTRTLMRLFTEQKAHVLGSDCHGAHHRVPNLLEGRELVKKKAGQAVLDQIDRNGGEILADIR